MKCLMVNCDVSRHPRLLLSRQWASTNRHTHALDWNEKANLGSMMYISLIFKKRIILSSANIHVKLVAVRLTQTSVTEGGELS